MKILIPALMFVGCAEPNVENTSPDEEGRSNGDELVFESIKACQITTQNVFIDLDKHADFISSDVKMRMLASNHYQITTQTRGSAVPPQKIFVTEQIPVCEQVQSTTKIYGTGEYEMTFTNTIDVENGGNPIMTLYDQKVDTELYIAKIEIKDGIRKCYSPNGVLLSESVSATPPDLGDFIAEMESYENQVQIEESTRAGQPRDVNWLRAKMEEHSTTRSGESSYYRIEELANGNVVLEQSVVTTDTRGAGAIFTRTELTPDISRPV